MRCVQARHMYNLIPTLCILWYLYENVLICGVDIVERGTRQTQCLRHRSTQFHSCQHQRSVLLAAEAERFVPKMISSVSLGLIDWVRLNVPPNTYRGRGFTGQMTQPTVSKHWRKNVSLGCETTHSFIVWWAGNLTSVKSLIESNEWGV